MRETQDVYFLKNMLFSDSNKEVSVRSNRFKTNPFPNNKRIAKLNPFFVKDKP